MNYFLDLPWEDWRSCCHETHVQINGALSRDLSWTFWRPFQRWLLSCLNGNGTGLICFQKKCGKKNIKDAIGIFIKDGVEISMKSTNYKSLPFFLKSSLCIFGNSNIKLIHSDSLSTNVKLILIVIYPLSLAIFLSWLFKPEKIFL